MLPKTSEQEKAQEKARAISKLKKRITTPQNYFFVKNRENIRFCYLVPRSKQSSCMKPQYLVFTFLKYEHLELAARLLKDAGLIDLYDAYKINNNVFYVKLYQFTYYEHTDGKGRKLGCKTKIEVEWTDLRLTKVDAENFLAHFYYNDGAKVIQMFSDSNTKRTA